MFNDFHPLGSPRKPKVLLIHHVVAAVVSEEPHPDAARRCGAGGCIARCPKLHVVLGWPWTQWPKCVQRQKGQTFKQLKDLKSLTKHGDIKPFFKVNSFLEPSGFLIYTHRHTHTHRERERHTLEMPAKRGVFKVTSKCKRKMM